MAPPQSASITQTTKPILVQILAYAPTQFYHCQHCEVIWHQVGAGQAVHQEQLASSIPQDLLNEYAALSAWVRATVETYCGRVVFKIIDAASLEGLLKALRYNARRYPAFIVDGKEKYIGTDFDAARRLIDQRLRAAQTVA